MNTNVKKLRSTLASLIREMGHAPARFVRNPRSDFTRHRKLGLEQTVSTLLCLGGGSLGQELLDCFGQNTPSVSAFVQQRKKLLPHAMDHLFHAFTAAIPLKQQYRGYRLIAVDGTSLKTAPYPKDPDSYLPGSQYQHGWNQLHLNALYDLENGLYVDASIQKERQKNESRALCEMIDQSAISAPAILLADRNYESYNNLAHLEKKGWSYLIRLRDERRTVAFGVSLPVQPEFDIPVCLTLGRMTPRQRRAQGLSVPEPYYHLPTACTFDFLKENSAETVTLLFRIARLKLSESTAQLLITNLDTRQFSLSSLKSLYARRWGIETAFRSLKYTVGLLHFHAKKPELVMQEVFSRLTVYNFAQTAVPKQAEGHVHFAAAVHLCRGLLRGSISPQTVIDLLAKCRAPNRGARAFPRPKSISGKISLFYAIA